MQGDVQKPNWLATTSQLHCFQSPTALLSEPNCIAFALRKHYCRSCAALLPKLCSIAAEVVQHYCRSCAALLPNLCSIAAQVVPACRTFSGTVFLLSIKTAIRNQFDARDDTKWLFLSPELFSFENKKKKRVSLFCTQLLNKFLSLEKEMAFFLLTYAKFS